MNDRMFELLSEAIPPAGHPPFVETQGLTTKELHAAIEHMRNDFSYAPSCGTPERPHVFHPKEFERLLPYEQFPQSYFAAQEWACCANCGLPWPLRPEEADGHP